MSTWSSSHSQPTRIFGWTDILARWNAGRSQPEVHTVLNNLSSAHQYPAQHYFNYMNEEQDALKWFIYECVASSWMWNSTPRVEYIRVALDLIENLDSNFPLFPGSPAGTVRQFLMNNLSDEHLEFVQMMPPLVRQSAVGVSSFCCASPATAAAAAKAPVAAAPQYAKIIFNIIRDSKKDSSDDMIVIGRESGRRSNEATQSVDESDETYTYTYTDKTSKASKKSCRHSGLSRSQVKNLLSTLLNLLFLDDEPFYALQVILPSTPSVMLKMDDLNSRTRDLLYEAVDNVMESWPLMV